MNEGDTKILYAMKLGVSKRSRKHMPHLQLIISIHVLLKCKHVTALGYGQGCTTNIHSIHSGPSL